MLRRLCLRPSFLRADAFATLVSLLGGDDTLREPPRFTLGLERLVMGLPCAFVFRAIRMPDLALAGLLIGLLCRTGTLLCRSTFALLICLVRVRVGVRAERFRMVRFRFTAFRSDLDVDR